MKTIRLKQPLNSFEEADTGSTLVASLEAGDYELLELKENHPNAETDYVQVFAPTLNRNVWICSRFKEADYATVVPSDEEASTTAETPEVSGFDEDVMAIDEKQLVDTLQQFADFGYDLHKPAYPFPLNGIKVPLAAELNQFQNNCCTFVEGLLVHAWQTAIEDFTWTNNNHGQMMIFSAEDYYSPITCLVERQMAVPVADDDAAPASWTVVQGWREQWKGGHTFIILDYHEETGRVLTLESNAAYKLNGVGYRMIGNIAEHPNPSANWWENERLWTWDKVKAAYAHRRQAQLKVKNISWV